MLATPFQGTLALRVLARRYLLLFISRLLLALTLPLRFPLKAVVGALAPFFVIFMVISVFPFSYGLLVAEELQGTQLPLKIGAGLLVAWLGAALATAAFTFWLRGPLEIVLDIFRYLCDPECRTSVQTALDA